MSYKRSAALQTAIYQALSADTTLSALVGTHVYDAMPSGTPPNTYVALGPESVIDRSDVSGCGSQHDLVVSIISTEPGFHGAKTVAEAVDAALEQAQMTLSAGKLVYFGFRKARALRIENGSGRRIDLTFRARIAN